MIKKTLVIAMTLFVVAALGRAQSIQSAGSGSWSQASTWTRLSGSGAFPHPGDSVLIQPGHRVTLNANKGLNGLAHLDIRGRLDAADTRDYRLRVSRIDIGRGGAAGATLAIGQSGRPFRHRFEIVLDDSHLSPLYGDPLEHLSLMVHPGASLDLHGPTQNAQGTEILSWLRLAEGHGLERGAQAMMLERPPLWREGDRIVLASTDFDMNQAEELTIKRINGALVEFSPALSFDHHGKTEFGVDERAEVGLLSRNIVITSQSSTALRGGHVMAMPGATSHGNLRLEGVELRRMGWHGALGRYPLHWHLCGALATGTNYIRNCSIHQTFNRAITIHQTDAAVVSDNVLYDVIGHALYLEDRTEVDNSILNNLGLVTKRPDPTGFVAALGDVWPVTNQPFFVVSDNEVSTFWITRAKNVVVGNVAAGSEFHGIWYDPEVTANLQQIGVWRDNVAHSNGSNGFHQEDARPFAFDANLANPLDAIFEVQGLTAYKNRQAGIWNRCYGQALFTGARLADNRIGVYFSSEGFQHDSAYEINIGPFEQQLTGAPIMSTQVLRDAIIVGETENRGNPTAAVELSWPGGPRSLPRASEPQWELKGVEIYDGYIAIEDTTFRNFRDVDLATPVQRNGETFALRPASALASRGERSTLIPGIPWGVDPRNRVSGLDIDGSVDHAVLFAIAHPPVQAFLGTTVNAAPAALVHGANGIHATMIFDLDGSLGGPPNTFYVNDNPLLVPNGAPAPVLVGPHHLEPIPVPGPSSAHTGEGYAQLMVFFASNLATREITHLKVTALSRGNGSLDVYDGHGSNAAEGQRVFATTLFTSTLNGSGPIERYEISYPSGHNPQNDPRTLALKFQFGENERDAMITLPYHGGPPSAIVCYPEVDPQRSIYLIPVNAPDLASALPFFDDGQHDEFDYWYDAANQNLVVKPTLYDPVVASSHPLLDGRAVVMIILN